MKKSEPVHIKILTLKPFDYLLIAVVLVMSFMSLLFIPNGGDTVTITCHGKVIYSDYLYKDAEITTPDGHNVITVENGVARMKYADCADNTCVKMGEATSKRPVACLPNEVMIIISHADDDIDGVTY